jgi:hypothetical protein
MNKLLQKLDRAAGLWLNAMDEHLQAPVAQTLSGDVFMIDATPEQVNAQSVVIQPVIAAALKSAPTERSAVRAPMILKPEVSHKR